MGIIYIIQGETILADATLGHKMFIGLKISGHTVNANPYLLNFRPSRDMRVLWS